MPYSRQRPRIAPTGQVPVRLSVAQRDLFLQSLSLPKDLGHRLHRAAVTKGKIEVRITREALETLIAVAVKWPIANKEAERALDTFLLYLEKLSDRFVEPDPVAED